MTTRYFITGIDGYQGFALAQYLLAQGHLVAGVDNLRRRAWVSKANGQSVIPIAGFHDRGRILKERHGDQVLGWWKGDTTDNLALRSILGLAQPDVIVHLAEQPSAPYSMADFDRAAETLFNNATGTWSLLDAMATVCPLAMLLHVSTMGEYGTPGVPIPEGVFRGDGGLGGFPFPRSPGSVYHASKVASGALVALAVKVWKLRAAVLYQGVVFGRTPILGDGGGWPLPTRFDIDPQFGTVLNRFCAQAVLGQPLTVYGAGGQTRGYISLPDVVRSVEPLAQMLAGQEAGKVLHVNHVTTFASVRALAALVAAIAGDLTGIPPVIESVPNPRVEAEEHSYQVDNQTILDLMGDMVEPVEDVIADTIGALIAERDTLLSANAVASPTWTGGKGNG